VAKWDPRRIGAYEVISPIVRDRREPTKVGRLFVGLGGLPYFEGGGTLKDLFNVSHKGGLKGGNGGNMIPEKKKNFETNPLWWGKGENRKGWAKRSPLLRSIDEFG